MVHLRQSGINSVIDTLAYLPDEIVPDPVNFLRFAGASVSFYSRTCLDNQLPVSLWRKRSQNDILALFAFSWKKCPAVRMKST